MKVDTACALAIRAIRIRRGIRSAFTERLEPIDGSVRIVQSESLKVKDIRRGRLTCLKGRQLLMRNPQKDGNSFWDWREGIAEELTETRSSTGSATSAVSLALRRE